MRRLLSRFAAAAALASACMVVRPGTAWAQGDPAAAETFFLEGLAAMKRNDFAVACEAFSRSNKADPSPGTQINLAVCYEKQKKWASAWTWYRSALGLAKQRGQAEREKLALEASARLEPQLRYLVIAVKEPLVDRVVRRDGVEVEIELAGKEVPLPVDPGEHTLEVSARGKKPWSQTIRIADAPGTDRVDVPALEDVATAAAVGPVPSTDGVAPRDDRPPVVEGRDGSGQRTLGLVVGITGLAAGITAAGFFAFAKSEESKSTQFAAQATDPNADPTVDYAGAARDRHAKAETNQTVAQVLGIGAGVFVTAGVVLYLTAPKTITTGRPRVLPMVGPSQAGLGLSGAF